MSFSIPYCEEVALDLSMSTMKKERISPASETATSANYVYNHYGGQFSPYNAIYGPGYRHQACVVPPAAVFPVTVESSVQLSPSSLYEGEPVYKTTGLAPSPAPAKSSEHHDVDFLDDDLEYQAFERDAMLAMAEKNGGTLLGNNPRMRRVIQTNQDVDDSYRRQRERNNYAAKQSRDKRKLREVRLALKVTYLKKKRDELRALLAAGVCSRCHLRQL